MRGLRKAADAGRTPLVAPRHEGIIRALRAVALAEVLQRAALGLPRPRHIEFCGIRFDVRVTSWGRVMVVDPVTEIRIPSAYGAV